jgi:hypothetical protein
MDVETNGNLIRGYILTRSVPVFNEYAIRTYWSLPLISSWQRQSFRRC